MNTGYECHKLDKQDEYVLMTTSLRTGACKQMMQPYCLPPASAVAALQRSAIRDCKHGLAGQCKPAAANTSKLKLPLF